MPCSFRNVPLHIGTLWWKPYSRVTTVMVICGHWPRRWCLWGELLAGRGRWDLRCAQLSTLHPGCNVLISREGYSKVYYHSGGLSTGMLLATRLHHSMILVYRVSRSEVVLQSLLQKTRWYLPNETVKVQLLDVSSPPLSLSQLLLAICSSIVYYSYFDTVYNFIIVTVHTL